MWDRITPPKIVPRAFVSFGRSRTLMAGMRSSGIGRTGYRERRSAEAQGLALGVHRSRANVLENGCARLLRSLEDGGQVARRRRAVVAALRADVDLGGDGFSVLELDDHCLAGKVRVLLRVELV